MIFKRASFLLFGAAFLSHTSPILADKPVILKCPTPRVISWVAGQGYHQWSGKAEGGWVGSTTTTGKLPQLTSLVDTKVFDLIGGQIVLSCSYSVENSSLEDKTTNVFLLLNNYNSCITENNKINNNTFICK